MPARNPLRAIWGGLRVPVLIAALLVILASCARYPTAQPMRIALLAPFEGRHRHVGYDALYAARLALHESGARSIELLPIDDGGTPVQAADRAAALAADPEVSVVIVLGESATQNDAFARFADLPVIVAGRWGDLPASDSVFILSAVTVGMSDALFFESANDGTVFDSSGRWPDDDFIRRYQANQMFPPEPTPAATLVYDAVGLAIHAMQTDPQRDAVRAAIADSTYPGYNGPIRFRDQVWQDAPIYRYTIHAGEIRPVNSEGEIVNPV